MSDKSRNRLDNLEKIYADAGLVKLSKDASDAEKLIYRFRNVGESDQVLLDWALDAFYYLKVECEKQK